MLSELFDLASTFVASSAWPIATVVVVFLLRRQLQSLIDRLESANTKWGDFTIAKVIEEIEAEFARVEGPIAVARVEETEKLVTNQVYAPVAEIMSAWVEVEQLCKQLLAKAGVSVPSNYRALGSR